MQPNNNHGTDLAHEELDQRFNQVLTPKVINRLLVSPQYTDEPVPARTVPDPRRLAKRPLR